MRNSQNLINKGLLSFTSIIFLIFLQGCETPSSQSSSQTTPLNEGANNKTSFVIESYMGEAGNEVFSAVQEENETDLNDLKELEGLEDRGATPDEASFSEEGSRFDQCKLKLDRFQRYLPEESTKNYKIFGRSPGDLLHSNGILQLMNISGILYVHREEAVSYTNVSGISYAFVNEVTHMKNVRGIHNIVADKIGNILGTGSFLTAKANPDSDHRENDHSSDDNPDRPRDHHNDRNPDDMDPGRNGNNDNDSRGDDSNHNDDPRDLDPGRGGNAKDNDGVEYDGDVSPHLARMKNNGIFCLEANEIAKIDGFSGIVTLIGKYHGTNRIDEIRNFNGILHVRNMDIGSLSHFKGIIKMQGGQIHNMDTNSIKGIVRIK